MYKKLFFAGLAVLGLSGCGMQGPLYLPPNPEDSYLSRIEKTLNEMTGQTTAVMAEPKDNSELLITDPDKLNVKDQSGENSSDTGKEGAAENESKPAARPVIPERNVNHESDRPSSEK